VEFCTKLTSPPPTITTADDDDDDDDDYDNDDDDDDDEDDNDAADGGMADVELVDGSVPCRETSYTLTKQHPHQTHNIVSCSTSTINNNKLAVHWCPLQKFLLFKSACANCLYKFIERVLGVLFFIIFIDQLHLAMHHQTIGLTDYTVSQKRDHNIIDCNF